MFSLHHAFPRSLFFPLRAGYSLRYLEAVHVACKIEIGRVHRCAFDIRWLIQA